MAIELVIHGRGGHGRVVADAWQGPHRFTDQRDGTCPGPRDVCWFVAIGDNKTRRQLAARFQRNCACPPATVIHALAQVSEGATIASGVYVGPMAVVNAGASVWADCIINTGAIVEHDCYVAEASHISPGAVLCGGAKISEGCWIGANAVVKEGVSIAPWTVVGCGAVVVHDIAKPGTYVGVPVRKLKQAVSA